jgi:phosphoribosyl 1,2-cyclic phosphodiesterase
VVQRISPQDLESPDSRERFLASLPDWIFGTVGGNTSCVEIETAQGDCIILDAGSGLRELSISLRERAAAAESPRTFHILFSHFHWDHLQGLPFFSQAFDPRNTIIFYSVEPNLREILNQQMRPPYFPVPMEGPGGFQAKLEFVQLAGPERSLSIGSSVIAWKQVNHPGGCTAFRISDGGKDCIYSTDTELTQEDFLDTPENRAFFSGADALIMDSQYTMGEALEKTGWGHSAFSVSVDFAITWGVRKLMLFHHEPTYTDKKIYSLRQSAQWYREYAGVENIDILIACEGQELLL